MFDAERIQRLNDIGFVLEQKRQQTFEERFNAWLGYRKTNNGLDPSQSTEIGSWTIRHKKFSKDKEQKSTLTDQQVDQLNAKGFIWRVIQQPDKKAPRMSWTERFIELNAYKIKYGHVSVPKKVSRSRCLGSPTANLLFPAEARDAVQNFRGRYEVQVV